MAGAQDAIVKGMLQHSPRSSTGIKELTDINALTDEYLRLSYHGLRAKRQRIQCKIRNRFRQQYRKNKYYSPGYRKGDIEFTDECLLCRERKVKNRRCRV